MAVENVVMMNVVGNLTDVNKFAKDIFLFNDIQLVDAMGEIDSGRFTLPVDEKNLEGLLGLGSLVPGSNTQIQKKYEQMTKKLLGCYDGQLKYEPETIKNVDLDADTIVSDTETFLDKFDSETDEIEKIGEDLQSVDQSIEAYSYLKELKEPMQKLFDMQFFKVELGSLTKDNAQRLKNIYPSITSVILHVGDSPKGEEVFLVITEKDFEYETDRMLKALNFKLLPGFSKDFKGTPEQIIEDLTKKEKELESKKEKLQAELKVYRSSNEENANYLYNELSMLTTINIMEGYMAFSDKNFYFSGWIPVKKEDTIRTITDQFPDMIVLFKAATPDLKPPTKLKNNWLFRPFEELVKMYGVPNYKELDPTPFLSLTYMFCFGFMFGDVGQGLVLLLGGLLLERKGNQLGGIAARIAVSSIIFGFLYGSVFGNETLLHPIWLRPMEDTNTLLITAVIFGVGMLIVAYIYGVINKVHQHQIEQGYFGKNGISGFILYLTILVTALGAMKYIPLPGGLVTAGICIIVGLTLLIYLQAMATNAVEHKPLTKGITGEYYVSSFFECFEMYLSMLSNTLSFIRVGAFALTHAGMFMAFQTLAQLAGGGVAGVIIMIFANIFIIVLEGLIDCIQCLRLEFYELFGKYYEGDGRAFDPVTSEVRRLDAAL